MMGLWFVVIIILLQKIVCYVIHTHQRTASFTAYLYKLFLCLLVICDQVAITNVFGDKVELFFGRNASMGHHCYMITHIDEFFKQNCKFNQITNYSSWNSNVTVYSLYFWKKINLPKNVVENQRKIVSELII